MTEKREICRKYIKLSPKVITLECWSAHRECVKSISTRTKRMTWQRKTRFTLHWRGLSCKGMIFRCHYTLVSFLWPTEQGGYTLLTTLRSKSSESKQEHVRPYCKHLSIETLLKTWKRIVLRTHKMASLKIRWYGCSNQPVSTFVGNYVICNYQAKI